MIRYIIYTIIVFFLALLQSSLFASLRLLAPIHILFIILFSYYIARENRLSLFLLFIGGIFLDFLTLSQIGVTSANFFISLLIYEMMLRVFPNERLGRAVSILISSVIFGMISYVSANFLASSDNRGVLGVIPWTILDAFMIFVISELVRFIKPAKKENKIRIN